MNYPKHVPGTKDYVGAEVEHLLEVAGVCSSTFRLYGYEPVILPVLEPSDIFLQRSGEEIRSRMYILRDPRGNEICLRPEMTISAARAFLEKMSSLRLPVRWSYQGEMFRYDKIREGRYRQFWQAGIECIGSENRVAADVESVMLALDVVNKTGLSDFKLLLGDLELTAEFINSLPVPAGVRSNLLENFWRREAFDNLLKSFAESDSRDESTTDPALLELNEMLSSLGERTSHLLVRQILSLFVEKEIGQRDLDEIAERFLRRFPRVGDAYLPRAYYEVVQEYLSISGPPEAVLRQVETLMQRVGIRPGPAFESAARRVEILMKMEAMPASVQFDLGFRRGIEYYTGFIFEIHCPRLGPVSQICGGGRYDRLLSSMGAPRPIPAVGFALGLDRLLLALTKSSDSYKLRSHAPVDAILITVGQVPEEVAWKVAQVCRESGWSVRLEAEPRRLKTVLSHASEEGVRFVIIAGEDEVRDYSVRIRDMIRHEEEVISINELEHYINRRGTKDQSAHKASPLGHPA